MKTDILDGDEPPTRCRTRKEEMSCLTRGDLDYKVKETSRQDDDADTLHHNET
jgi:hypothetical protein